MHTQHKPNLSSTSVAFLASLLGHGLVLLYLSVFTQPPPSPPSSQQGEVVPLLSKQQVDRLLRRVKQPPRYPKKKERAEEKTEPPSPKGQVVDIPPPERTQKPKQARFLAEFNSAVEREMVHINAQSPQPKMRRSERRSMSGGDDERGSRKGQRGARRPSSTRQQAKPSAQPARPKTRSSQARRSTPVKPQRRVVVEGEGPFKRSPTTREAEQAHQGDRASRTSAQRGAMAPPTHYQSLLPTLGPQDLERLEGSIDHVLNVPKGNKSALNTREYRFAHFFNRVKREVSERWRAIDVYRAHDPRGQVYGVQDRQTVLNVTLDASGALAGVEVIQSSGVRALDLEAIEAFKRAQPFYNPPKGLADPDGKIRFKFGFFLEINSGGFRFLP